MVCTRIARVRANCQRTCENDVPANKRAGCSLSLLHAPKYRAHDQTVDNALTLLTGTAPRYLRYLSSLFYKRERERERGLEKDGSIVVVASLFAMLRNRCVNKIP